LSFITGSKNESEERRAAQEKLLREMEQSLDHTQKMIEQTRRLLDEATAGAGPDAPPDGSAGPA
jgi:hypothetical protein